MTRIKFDIEKFDGKNDFALWQITRAKGDGGEGLYVREIYGAGFRTIDSAWSKSQERSSRPRCYICQSEEHLKRDCLRYNHNKSQGFVKVSDYEANGYDSADVMMAISVEELLDWIMNLRGSYHITYKRDYLVDFKEYNNDNLLLGDGKECVVRGTGTLEKEGFTVKMQSGKIKIYTTMYKERGRQKFGVVVIQQQNGLVKETNVTLLTKGNKIWRLDEVTSKVVLYRNMGFNESGEYKKAFIGSVVGTGSVQAFQEVEFEVKSQEDHAFKVEPLRNVGQGAGSYKVISKWKTGLKDDMNARSDVCKAEIWATKGLLDKAKRNVLGIEIVRDQIGNTLRASQSRFYNEKLVQTLLEGHFILSLEGSLSGDFDVENKSKGSYIHAVESQEYQGVCTRPDIASAYVGMADGFDREVQMNVHVFVDFDYAVGRSITVMDILIISDIHDTYRGCKGGYLTKGTRNRVRIRAKDSNGYCYRCIVKGYP
nr:zinc finger, CCHC-type [Tanacetum cinerariifolium]